GRLPAGAPPGCYHLCTNVHLGSRGRRILSDRTGDHILAYLLKLIGDPYVATAFSWGSVVLASLYRVMGRATFFTGGSQKGTGDLGGFTLFVQLWVLERFPQITERYTEQGAPPADDSLPRGLRCIPSITDHQRVMWLDEIRYVLDRYTEFLVRIIILYSSNYLLHFNLTTFSFLRYFLLYFLVDVVHTLQRDLRGKVGSFVAVCHLMLCFDAIAWQHLDRCLH
ncbi:hypothetical protein LINPERHAP1_LOCUS13019, partial [Linum perenne]